MLSWGQLEGGGCALEYAKHTPDVPETQWGLAGWCSSALRPLEGQPDSWKRVAEPAARLFGGSYDE